jgi:hypothetical protein
VLSFPLLLVPPTRQSPPLYSCPIISIILGLDSTYKQKHAIFDFLSLVYLTEHDDLQFYPFSCKQHNFILLYG